MDKLGNTLGDDSTRATTVQSSTHIHELPVEVLVQIFSNLDPVQLNSIRLVCKRWKFAVSDKETWLNSFSLKFGTPHNFPSLTDSRHWMVEYFERLKTYKKWNKAVAVHRSYTLINNEFRNIDSSLVNFNNNDGWGKLLTFSSRFGNVSICNLKNGRNQSFIPGGNSMVGQILSHAINWNYLLVSRISGDLVLKNLLTSTSAGSSRSSNQVLVDEEDDSAHSAVLMNNMASLDKQKQRSDILAGTVNGVVKWWNFSGKVIHRVQLDPSPILNLRSDFKNFVIVNTACKIYIIHFSNYKILATIDLEYEVLVTEETLRSSYRYYGNPTPETRNTMDVDFGGCNIVACYLGRIDVYNFSNLNDIAHRELVLPHDTVVTISQLQTCTPTKVNSYKSINPSVVGSDGLLYANALSDGSVLIWNVRDYSGPGIVPISRIVPEFNKYSPDISSFVNRDNIKSITAVVLNATVVAIGGYNGFTNLHNVFTGEFIKEASVKFPKKMTHMYNELVPVNQIVLNERPKETNGLILCGDTVQYFQFGETELLNSSSTMGTTGSSHKKKVNPGVVNKHQVKKKIRDGIDDYDSQVYMENKRQEMFEKYNGSFENEEEELSMALALSQSYHQNPSDDELAQALDLSQQEQNRYYQTEDDMAPLESTSSAFSPSYSAHTTAPSSASLDAADEDEQLKRILELSLLEQ